MAFSLVHLGDMIEDLGEEQSKKLIANFSCPFDEDIEYFLSKKAILFHKSGLARTYLVYTSYKKESVLVGYFALAPKTLTVAPDVSNTLRKRLTGSKTTEYNEIPVFLIGQLSKNYINDYNKLITGEQLLYLAFEQILLARRIIGGRIILVECKKHPRLTEFYTKYGFIKYDVDKQDELLRYIREVNGINLV